MLETFDLRNDRLGLGDQILRNPGFDVANAESKLLILGKPGSGKTTFLKHIAIDWCHGRFKLELVAVFIEFREIQDIRWNLIAAIDHKLGINNWQNSQSERDRLHRLEAQKELLLSRRDLSRDERLSIDEEIKSARNLVERLENPINEVLRRGRLLLLMDGFDEIRTQESRLKIQNQIDEFSNNFPRNRIILTCRTQIVEYLPSGFTAVEVADFSNIQVEQFVRNWFQAKQLGEKYVIQQWEIFNREISNNFALKELTVTPVLLGLICLVLQDEGDMPTEIAELYERGTKLLLAKWNDTKVIKGWELGTTTYRELSLSDKEDLLIEIAARKFENPKNFVLFQEEDLIRQISSGLNLFNVEDSKAILKAIETQHGLLIERADGLWSFSHLTFQEYFTTKWLLRLSSEDIGRKIGDKRWQEVVQQLVKSQGQSDRLLRLIKKAIDYSIPQDDGFRALVQSSHHKIKIDIFEAQKPFFIRAVCFVLFANFPLDLPMVVEPGLDSTKNTISKSISRRRRLFNTVMYIIISAHKVDFSDLQGQFFTLRLFVEKASRLSSEYDILFSDTLTELKEQLTNIDEGKWENFEKWWKKNGFLWKGQLCKATLNYFGIDDPQVFSLEQAKYLRFYYDANCFLVKLLSIQYSVSPEARQEIADNLLLPIAELKRRLPDQYGGIEED